MTSGCIFCKIVKGDSPCFKVFENKNVLAFLDIDPISKGHTLIVPKKHAGSLFDIGSKDLQEIGKVTQSIARILKDKFKFETVSLMQTNGKAQDVPHFHLHVFGRDSKNDIQIKYPITKVKLSDSVMRVIAGRLNSEL